MTHCKVPIRANRAHTRDCWCMEVHAPAIAAQAAPGQFVHVRCGSGYTPLLRRPFSIHWCHGETLAILYQIVGPGTTQLAALSPGDTLDLLGPLGHGFTIPADRSTAVLVGGGMGIAPLQFLAEHLLHRHCVPRVVVIYGASTVKNLVCYESLQRLNLDLFVATEDGTLGRCGTVIDCFKAELPGLRRRGTRCYGCGPVKMLHQLVRVADSAGLECEVALEEMMACGVGACRGCTVLTHSGYQRVCTEGPVFPANEIAWTAAGVPTGGVPT